MKRHIVLLVGLILVTLSPGCKKKGGQPTASTEPVTIKVGHVGHDHHTALFVALDNAADYKTEIGIDVTVIEDQKLYELTEDGRKIATVEIVKVGGGSKMPTALAQGVIDVGFGGVAPVLAAVDSNTPIKLISPLHYKGDMFVVRPDFKAQTWTEFVAAAKATDRPLRIGYKSPVACAKVIFEEALKHEGVTFGGDLTAQDLQVKMVNVKGGGKLNVALAGRLIDGYVGNNPFPSIAVEKSLGRIVCDLEALPPGTFRDHPCCCIAATTKALAEKSAAVTALLRLFLHGTATINNDTDKAVAAAVRWIGTSEEVERTSIPTSGYSMDVSQRWLTTMDQWIVAMNGLDVFRGSLKGLEPQKVDPLAYDFSLLKKAGGQIVER